MVNEAGEPKDAGDAATPDAPASLAQPAPKLVILATDDDAVCVDELCLPQDAPRRSAAARASEPAR